VSPAFLLMCYLGGVQAGMLNFENVNTCNYFKKALTGQTVFIGKDEKRYSCYCKLVKIDKDKVEVF